MICCSYLAHLHVSSSGGTPIHADDIAVVLGETGEDEIAEENNNLEASVICRLSVIKLCTSCGNFCYLLGYLSFVWSEFFAFIHSLHFT